MVNASSSRNRRVQCRLKLNVRSCVIRQTRSSSALVIDICFCFVHVRTPLNYCTAASCCSSARIPMRLQRSDLAAVDSPSMYDHMYDMLRCIRSLFLIELTTLSRINTLQQPSFSIRPAKQMTIHPNFNTKCSESEAKASLSLVRTNFLCIFLYKALRSAGGNRRPQRSLREKK